MSEIGEHEKAKSHYRRSISLYEEHGLLPSWVRLNQAALVRADVVTHQEAVNLKRLYQFDSDNSGNGTAVERPGQHETR